MPRASSCSKGQTTAASSTRAAAKSNSSQSSSQSGTREVSLLDNELLIPVVRVLALVVIKEFFEFLAIHRMPLVHILSCRLLYVWQSNGSSPCIHNFYRFGNRQTE